MQAEQQEQRRVRRRDRTWTSVPTTGSEPMSVCKGSFPVLNPDPRLPRMAASHARNISSGTPVPAMIAVRIFLTSPCSVSGLPFKDWQAVVAQILPQQSPLVFLCHGELKPDTARGIWDDWATVRCWNLPYILT